jgi:hypothetical protein
MPLVGQLRRMPEKRFFPGTGIHWTLADFSLLIQPVSIISPADFSA